jgi:nicotinamide riboside transporter PnuC
MALTNLTILADYMPYILILGGIIAASWLFERTIKPLSWIIKIASFFGFIIGILLMITAAVVWPTPDGYTQYLLIATGLALILKPIKDIPWAALIASLIGGLCAGYVYLYIPLETVFGISSTWVYLIIFFVPALLVYVLFKFIEDLLRLVGAILASRPVSIILGLICIVQGFLLLLNKSLFTILFG